MLRYCGGIAAVLAGRRGVLRKNSKNGTYRLVLLVQDSNNVSIGGHMSKVLVQFHIQPPILRCGPICAQLLVLLVHYIGHLIIGHNTWTLKELNLYFVDESSIYLLNQELCGPGT